MMKRLIEGQVLTRKDIAVLYGGNARAFLPRVNGGDVVAGCFDPEMNPRAPYEALVHSSPNAVLAARRLLGQGEAGTGVPVFLRRAANVWEFVGHFRAVSYVDDREEIARRVYEIRPRVYERHVRDYGSIRGILLLEEA